MSLARGAATLSTTIMNTTQRGEVSNAASTGIQRSVPSHNMTLKEKHSTQLGSEEQGAPY
jgi:hypothetical protein